MTHCMHSVNLRHNMMLYSTTHTYCSNSCVPLFQFGEKGSGIRAPNSASIQDFQAIRERCKANGELFDDVAFPPCESSLYYSSGRRKEIQWVRASELTETAAFINEGLLFSAVITKPIKSKE